MSRRSLPFWRRRLGRWLAALALALALVPLPGTARGADAARGGAAPNMVETDVWSSPALCRTAVETGHARMAQARAGTLRLGAWNIEWFPDHTDIGWLACTITWMNLDLLAIEEFRATPKADAQMRRLLVELGRLTGAEWRVDLQRCGARPSQHVGFIWNAKRLRLVAAGDSWPLNARAQGDGAPCAGYLRPGRAADFVPLDGTTPGFRAIAVHLKSGATAKDLAERRVALARLGAAASGADGMRVVVLGDFNSMGDGTRDSGAAEVRALDRIAVDTSPGFTHPMPAPSCTEYYRGRGGALDHALVSRSLGYVAADQVQVTGYCALARCAPIRAWREVERPAAYRALSDHCPLVIGLAPPPDARDAMRRDR